MGIMVNSLEWVMQDFVHQPHQLLPRRGSILVSDAAALEIARGLPPKLATRSTGRACWRLHIYSNIGAFITTYTTLGAL